MIYVTALEFKKKLSMELFWLVAGLITHEKATLVEGGMSAIFAKVLNHWVNSSYGILNKAGFSLEIDGAHYLVRFALHAFVADEAALRSVLQSKGASGMKPCAKCYNVISKFHGGTWDIHGDECIIDVTCATYQNFLQFTDQQIFDVQRQLQETYESGTASELKRQEQICGFLHSPKGLLADPLLRDVLPPSKCHYDFLHTLFSNGIVCDEICLFWKRVCAETNLTTEDLQQFCKEGGFTLKQSIGEYKLNKVFDAKYLDKSTYGGDAGYAVLALFLLETFATNLLDSVVSLKRHIACLTKLCWVCRWYFRLKSGKCKGIIAPSARMFPLFSEHLVLFQSVYGRSLVRPKHHFNFHCAESMDIQEAVLDCWTLERKHRIYKNTAQNFPMNDSFESSMLGKLLMTQEEQLSDMDQDPSCTPYAHDQDLANQLGCQTAWLSRSMRFNEQTFHKDDICLFTHDVRKAGRVICCVAAEWSGSSQRFLMLELLVRSDSVSADLDPWHLSQWQPSVSRSLVNLATHAEQLLWPFFWWSKFQRIIVSC